MEKEKAVVVDTTEQEQTEQEQNEKLEKIAKFRHEIEVLTYYLGAPLTDSEREGVENRITQLKAEVVYIQQGHNKEAEQAVAAGKTKEVAFQSKLQRAAKKAEDAKAEYDSLVQQAQQFQEKRAKKIAEALAKDFIG